MQLGLQSRRWRFGAVKPTLSTGELALLARVDPERLVLVARAGGHPIGLAHLMHEPETGAADVAVAIADQWRRLGVGVALARRLASETAASGIVHVHALIAADNRASLRLMKTATTLVETRFEGSDLHLVGRVEPAPPVRSGAILRCTNVIEPHGPTVAMPWPRARRDRDSESDRAPFRLRPGVLAGARASVYILSA